MAMELRCTWFCFFFIFFVLLLSLRLRSMVEKSFSSPSKKFGIFQSKIYVRPSQSFYFMVELVIKSCDRTEWQLSSGSLVSIFGVCWLVEDSGFDSSGECELMKSSKIGTWLKKSGKVKINDNILKKISISCSLSLSLYRGLWLGFNVDWIRATEILYFDWFIIEDETFVPLRTPTQALMFLFFSNMLLKWLEEAIILLGPLKKLSLPTQYGYHFEE